MQETETPGTLTGTARRPYAQSMMVFRAAVYDNPRQVSLSIPGNGQEEEPSVLWVSDMQPGESILVNGKHGDHMWRATLTCESLGKFSVRPYRPGTEAVTDHQ